VRDLPWDKIKTFDAGSGMAPTISSSTSFPLPGDPKVQEPQDSRNYPWDSLLNSKPLRERRLARGYRGSLLQREEFAERVFVIPLMPLRCKKCARHTRPCRRAPLFGRTDEEGSLGQSDRRPGHFSAQNLGDFSGVLAAHKAGLRWHLTAYQNEMNGWSPARDAIATNFPDRLRA